MEFIEKLEQTKAETLNYFRLKDEDLARPYGPGKWTVRYVLHHLADSESVLLYRIRRLISEPKQVIWVYDQEAWAEKLKYSTLPLELSRNVYLASRDAILHYAREHYEDSDHIKFVHSETGLQTLKDEFDKVVWHNRKHLDTVAAALRG